MTAKRGRMKGVVTRHDGSKVTIDLDHPSMKTQRGVASALSSQIYAKGAMAADPFNPNRMPPVGCIVRLVWREREAENKRP